MRPGSDAALVNSFPTWTSTGLNATNFAYDIAAAGWNSSIGPEAAALVPQLSGCYARVHPGTDLRIISVNSNYWYKQNCELRPSPVLNTNAITDHAEVQSGCTRRTNLRGIRMES